MKEEERMYGAIREIMKDDLLRAWQEGYKEGYEEARKERQRRQQEAWKEEQSTVAERMINLGKPGSEISLVTDLGRQDIDKIAQKMNRTVYWNEGRA